MLQLFIGFRFPGPPTYGFTEFPEQLPTVYDQVYILTPPLPADQACSLYRRLPSWGAFSKPDWRFRMCLIRLHFFCRRRGFGLTLLPQRSEKPSQEEPPACEALEDALSGRLLTRNALMQQLRQEGYWPRQVLLATEWAVANGRVVFWPGIQETAWGERTCVRCGSRKVQLQPCVRCRRRDCPLCLECGVMGEIRGCSILLTAPRTAPASCGEVALHLPFALSPAQQLASDKLVSFLASSDEKVLVWAACGAGKTEVVYAAILQVLRQGGQVLFAIPRRDIVRELGERLAQSFSGVSIAVHYGGQPLQQQGRLVIATTHQVLRFYQRFDLVVLDEVDAFPYQGSEMLRFAIERAATSTGKRIEMTATPTVSSRCPVIKIPARYHGHPLPVPTFCYCKLSDATELATQLPQELVQKVAQSPLPWLFFAPTVAWVKRLPQQLAHLFGCRADCCYASDPKRDQKLAAFNHGQIQMLVATSVLERGITISGVQVIVLGADHPLFTENALIQMAGRVGRKAQSPTGEVFFLGHRHTAAIRKATKKIQQLNKEALDLGLLTRGNACVD